MPLCGFFFNLLTVLSSWVCACFSAGLGYGLMELPSLADRAAQKPTAPPERLTPPRGLQFVPAAPTRFLSARPGWRARRRGARAPSAALGASTRTGRPTLRDILSGRWQGPLATAAWGTTNPWRPRLSLRYTWDFCLCLSERINLSALLVA